MLYHLRCETCIYVVHLHVNFGHSPVTDEILLIEDGSIGAKEGCGAAVLLAHIERLQRGVTAGQIEGKETWQSAAVSV